MQRTPYFGAQKAKIGLTAIDLQIALSYTLSIIAVQQCDVLMYTLKGSTPGQQE
ncbi:hypothetical protein TERTU_2755 [Teredinibacter turnerae T7901]|uniref:Uncharacterized protein n=1 Tax=Teredinibacter turnerae (strain ATCC 39867 / T7901) TaxID=377629 RepID=C5BMK3_TERTT|nr:hypothetical protein TERTU_2755 [Teredinibacter turnerae T7901]